MKKLFMFLFLGIFMLSLASAADWDNCRSYDDNTKTVTISNNCPLGIDWFSTDIADVTLIGEEHRVVGAGYQLVQEWEFETKQDYQDAIKNMVSYDINSDKKKRSPQLWKEIERQYDFKIRQVAYEEVPVYITQCSDNLTSYNETINGTIVYDQVCEEVQNGTEQKEIISWTPIENNGDLPKGNFRVGVFTNVQVGDYVEIIPTIMGVDVPEWASFSQSLTAGLVSYYRLDETTGIVLDDMIAHHGTNNGATRGVAGKVNNSFDFDGAGDYVSITGVTTSTSFTISMWVNASASDGYLFDSQTGRTILGRHSSEADYLSYYDGTSWKTSSQTFSGLQGSWNHVVLVVSGTNAKIYVNNNNVMDKSVTSRSIGGTANVGISYDANVNTAYTGTIDEVGIWNRTLNTTEIAELYNSGTGTNDPRTDYFWTDYGLDTNLVSYYKMDEASGTIAYDETGTFNLTEVGTTTTPNQAEAVINKSWRFENDNNHLESSSNSGISGADPRTIAGWIYLDDASSPGLIMAIGTNTDGDEWALGVSSSEEVYLTGYITGDQNSGVIISTGAWHHLAATYDGTYVALYSDGILILNNSHTYTTTNSHIQLGYRTGWGAGQEGYLDEIGLWSEALNSTQVEALFNYTKALVYGSSSGPTGNITVVLNSPANAATLTSLDVTFNASINNTEPSVLELDNVSLYIDGVLNETNSSGISGDYIFTKTLADGSYNWTVVAVDNESTSYTTSTRTFTVDTTPNIQFISPTPADGTNTTNTYIETNVSLTETYFQNLTIYLYENSTLNQSVTFTNSTRFFNFTGLTDNYYQINATTCTTTGKCNSTETREILVDITPPVFNGTPMGPFDILIYNDTLDVNWTIVDEGVGVDSCWLYYNSTRYDVNCTDNHTTINYVPNVNTLTGYANDTLGQEINVTINWNVTIAVSNIEYDTTVLETALEPFIINFTYDSSDWISSDISLYYNLTEYDAEITGTGDSVSSLYELSTPLVDALTTLYFNWTIELTNATGTYYISTPLYPQNVSKIIFELCNYSQNPQLFFQTFSTLDPATALNATFQSAWTIQDATGGTLYLSDSFQDLTETNSSWGFCISPNSSNYTLSAQIEVDATNYTTTSHYIVDTDYSTPGENISLYLLHDDYSTLTELEVETSDHDPVEDVYITIQRYDVGTDTYYNVGMARTDTTGSDLAYLNWYDTWYRFIGVYNGEVVFTEGPERISASPRKFTIAGAAAGSDYEKFRDISYTFYFNNATDNFVVSFVDPTGEVASACLRTIKRNVTNDYLICDTCETSNSATIYCNIAAWGNGTFIADFYAIDETTYYIDQLYEYKNVDTPFFDLIGNDNGTGISIILAGIVLSMFLITPALGVFGMILGMIACIALGFQPFDYASFIGIVVVGGAIMWAVQR